MKKTAFFILICVFFLASIKTGAAEKIYDSALELPENISVVKTIKVAVLKNEVRVPVKNLDGSIVTTIETAEKLGELASSRKNAATPIRNGVRFGADEFKIYGVRLRPKRESFEVNGRQYRENAIFIKEFDGRLTVINELGLEDYLKGVLPLEVKHDWPEEVLKAQAVAARTYAVFNLITNWRKDYAVYAGVENQCYGGLDAEKKETNRAVKKTAGEILVRDGAIFPAYFHSTCGGMTEAARRVWSVKRNPALRGGVKCGYCADSKYFFWTSEITLDEIRAKLRKAGYDVGRIQSVKPLDFGKSGRWAEVAVYHSKGKLTLGSNKFRLIVGSGVLRSTKCTIAREGGRLVFSGFGWGHGVGMCQWGARSLAEKGWDYKEILKYYYPGSKIKKI